MTKVPSSDPRVHDSTAPDDAELVMRCRRGDQEAWRELVERHARLVNGVLRGVFRLASHDAEDVFQEVFTRVYVRLGSLRDEHAVGSWIAQIARNAALDQLRSASDLTSEDGIEDRAFDEPFAALEQSLAVRSALARLPSQQQEILDRFFARDESYHTIGAVLGIPAGTIASRISRALSALRHEFEAQEV
jgi:RNA polymerase sigma-70 factor (ECF subfamily)